MSSGTARTSTPGTVTSASEVSTSQPSSRPPSTARAVVAADGLGARLDADRGEAGVGHAAHRRAADDRRDADDGLRAQRLGDARHLQDRADAHHRVARREHHDVGLGDRVEHAGRRRRRCSAPIATIADAGSAGPVAHPPLLEVDHPLAALGAHAHVGLDAVVAHRQQPRAGLPARAQRLGDLRERVAGVEHLPPHQVGGEVAVAEPEPGGRDVVRLQLLAGVERLVLPAPAALLVDAAAERVHHRVEVGADAQAVHRDVVAGVDDDRQLGVGDGRLQAAQEPGAADAAGEGDDLHAV